MSKKLIIHLFISICLTLAVSPIIAYGEIETTIYARNTNSEDTWIASGDEAGTPHGNSYEVWIANNSDYIAQGMLKFTDLSEIPPGSVIHDVRLDLYCDWVSGSDYLDVYRVTGSWNESSVTYITGPTIDSSKLICTQYYSTTWKDRYNNFNSSDLTALVQGWVDGTIPNNGILISDRTLDSSVFQFRSSENGMDYYPPRLLVSYTPEKRLNVPYYNQAPCKWCAAASATMLLNYYGKNKELWDFANTLNWTCYEGLQDFWEFLDVSETIGQVFSDAGLTYERKGTIYNPWLDAEMLIGYIKSQLALGRPVWLGSRNWKHAIVVTGFDTESGGHFYVHDPDPGGTYVNSILQISGARLVNQKVDYSDFYDSVDDIGIVLTYVITSPKPDRIEGLSVYPNQRGLYPFQFYNLTAVLDDLILSMDGKTYPYGYYWSDESEKFDDDGTFGNLVTTSEDLRGFGLQVVNSNIISKTVRLKMGLRSTTTQQEYVIFENYSVTIGPHDICTIDNDQFENGDYMITEDYVIDLSQYTPDIYEIIITMHDETGSVEIDNFDLKFKLVASSDVAPPLFPQNLTVTPSTWTNDNSFDVSWDNPDDASGIQAAWYKISSLPQNNEDGTRIEGRKIHTLPTLTAPSEGTNNLYVWLEDGAGNKII